MSCQNEGWPMNAREITPLVYLLGAHEYRNRGTCGLGRGRAKRADTYPFPSSLNVPKPEPEPGLLYRGNRAYRTASPATT